MESPCAQDTHLSSSEGISWEKGTEKQLLISTTKLFHKKHAGEELYQETFAPVMLDWQPADQGRDRWNWKIKHFQHIPHIPSIHQAVKSVAPAIQTEAVWIQSAFSSLWFIQVINSAPQSEPSQHPGKWALRRKAETVGYFSSKVLTAIPHLQATGQTTHWINHWRSSSLCAPSLCILPPSAEILGFQHLQLPYSAHIKTVFQCRCQSMAGGKKKKKAHSSRNIHPAGLPSASDDSLLPCLMRLTFQWNSWCCTKGK